ncbi:hypothetical protein EF919_18205 [Streptomyces sp. WAC02707]|uniref:hypothetical protein n=1 Tax=Streptomyces TaxID=1883 RepID=UPI000F76E09F|nr:hypothetical protein [Streptomyces sp. WAC02707]RSS92467.1 hypothetical protein EF919_18205 [Streptomyces sp. WAC02707]
MPIRYGVQADTRDECAEGLARLIDVGMLPIMMPTMVSDGRWLARAVPSPTTPVRDPVDQ